MLPLQRKSLLISTGTQYCQETIASDRIISNCATVDCELESYAYKMMPLKLIYVAGTELEYIVTFVCEGLIRRCTKYVGLIASTQREGLLQPINF